MAKKKTKKKEEGAAQEAPEAPRGRTRENFEAILVAVLFALFVRTFVAQAFQIPTGSMEENLLVGDHLIVNKFVFSEKSDLPPFPSRPIRRHDVVIFKAPEDPSQDYVKRVIGLPGDSIMVHGRRVFVNNRVLEENGEKGYRAWWKAGGMRCDARRGYEEMYGVCRPFIVPPDHYFVMGDNRDASQDSRVWGPLPREAIKGRPLAIYWSYESERNPHIGTLREKIGRIADRVLHFFSKTRWERTFKPIR
jgi:signal peptidase I